ncbi:MAG: BrxE family protein [Syntrophobacteraceae bacterium]
MEDREAGVDLERLFKLRLLVARYGEMDIARWWNTNGILGRYGALAISRGFPRTHYFAQARIAFAVARNRCEEVFNPPECMTLWNLPAELEDQFEGQWHTWLDHLDQWIPFFKQLESIQLVDLLGVMQEFDLISPTQVQSASKLRLATEGKAVPTPGFHKPDNEALVLLAAGFSCAPPGKLAVPYARLEV